MSLINIQRTISDDGGRERDLPVKHLPVKVVQLYLKAIHRLWK